MPPDMPEGVSCHRHKCTDDVRLSIRRALLDHDAVYIGGSADVCNWRLQQRFEPQCGWCLHDRQTYMNKGAEFARDLMSPVVDSCRAMWEGFTRFERMKIYMDAFKKIIAPRVGVSEAV